MRANTETSRSSARARAATTMSIISLRREIPGAEIPTETTNCPPKGNILSMINPCLSLMRFIGGTDSILHPYSDLVLTAYNKLLSLCVGALNSSFIPV